ADLVEPLRHRIAQDVQVGVLGEVGGEADDALVGAGELEQRLAERGGDGALPLLGEVDAHRAGAQGGCGGAAVHRASSSSSVRWAAPHSSSETRMKCSFSLASRKSTPLPRVVSTTSTRGRGSSLPRSSVRCWTRAGRSCPEQRRASQPKASNLSVTGSIESMWVDFPSACWSLKSTMAMRLSRPWWAATAAASQVEPSPSSPSESRL